MKWSLIFFTIKNKKINATKKKDLPLLFMGSSNYLIGQITMKK